MSHSIESLSDLLISLGETLARQREALSEGRLESLGELNSELESSYQLLERWPGGLAAVNAAIDAAADQQRIRLRELLVQLSTDNRISGELIRVAMHRVATIRAFQSAGSAAATYRPGPVSDVGSMLSRRA